MAAIKPLVKNNEDSDACFKNPIAYSIPGQAVGFSRWLDKRDWDLSVNQQLREKEAGE